MHSKRFLVPISTFGTAASDRGGAARNESSSSRLAGATRTMSAAAGAVVGAAFALSMLYALPAYAHASALQQTTTHENVLTTVSETQDSTTSTKDAADDKNAASTQDEAGKSQQNSQQHLLQNDAQQQTQQEQKQQTQLEEQTQVQPQAQPADLHWVRNGYGVWYRNQDGSYPYNTWTHDSEGWHYFDSWGYAVSGWYKVPSGKWFYFDPRQEHHRLVVGDCLVNGYHYWIDESAGLVYNLSLIHISEPTRPVTASRMPSSA